MRNEFYLKGSTVPQDNKGVKELEATGTKLCTSTIKRALYHHDGGTVA